MFSHIQEKYFLVWAEIVFRYTQQEKNDHELMLWMHYQLLHFYLNLYTKTKSQKRLC